MSEICRLFLSVTGSAFFFFFFFFSQSVCVCVCVCVCFRGAAVHSWNMLASYHNIYTFSFLSIELNNSRLAIQSKRELHPLCVCPSIQINNYLFFCLVLYKQSPCSSAAVSWLWRNEITQPLGSPPPLFFFFLISRWKGNRRLFFLTEHSWSGEFWLCVGCI